MALNELRPITPRLPSRESLTASRVSFDYDELSDTLMVYLDGSRPAVSDPVGDYLST